MINDKCWTRSLDLKIVKKTSSKLCHWIISILSMILKNCKAQKNTACTIFIYAILNWAHCECFVYEHLLYLLFLLYPAGGDRESSVKPTTQLCLLSNPHLHLSLQVQQPQRGVWETRTPSVRGLHRARHSRIMSNCTPKCQIKWHWKTDLTHGTDADTESTI